jgi:lysozyme family protein
VASNFETAIAFVLNEEGGYVNDPHDPGGETNFGISKRAYPTLDIATLSRQGAIDIYRRNYWDRINGEGIPTNLCLVALDCAVNQGVGRALQLLAQTHSAVEFQLLRLEHYASGSNWGVYGQGWTRRLLRGLDAQAKLAA